MWELHVKCSDGGYFEPPQMNIGGDATEIFLDQVLDAATICREHLANKILMTLLTQEYGGNTTTPRTAGSVANHSGQQVKKVRNHNHLFGEYRGPVQNVCNLNYPIDPKKVKMPCIIHNLKGISFLCYSYFHNC